MSTKATNPSPKRRVPSPARAESEWRDKEKLTLAQVATEFVAAPAEKSLVEPPTKWGGYFQSPFSKRAHTLDGSPPRLPSFAFDHKGALREEAQKQASIAVLKQWIPDLSNDQCRHLQEWLLKGSPLPFSLLGAIACELERLRLKPEFLHNQPICRLVQRDQVLFDPHYQAVYQLTPSQMRLLSVEPQGRGNNQSLAEVRKCQRVFWALSEDFQSAIAMFDSDFGRASTREEQTRHNLQLRKEIGTPGFRLTKEFIRLQTGARTSLTPQQLNRFSPLRFWAPPPAFAHCVFHMLFWQPILTGYDLYHRPFPSPKSPPDEDILKARVNHYALAVNRFQAATYRITDYVRILALLAEIAAAVEKSANNLTGVSWRSSDLRSRWFLATHALLDPSLKPPTQADVVIKLLPDSLNLASDILDLDLPYYFDRAGKFSGTQDCAAKLLFMLRDRILQLLLWAHYQMEIRSVGTVPIHRLYRIELDESLLQKAVAWSKTWFDGRSGGGATFDALEKEMASYISEGKSLDNIRLIKIYDRALGQVQRDDGQLPWLDRYAHVRKENHAGEEI